MVPRYTIRETHRSDDFRRSIFEIVADTREGCVEGIRAICIRIDRAKADGFADASVSFPNGITEEDGKHRIGGVCYDPTSTAYPGQHFVTTLGAAVKDAAGILFLVAVIGLIAVGAGA
jgi:hypothetical protein